MQFSGDKCVYLTVFNKKRTPQFNLYKTQRARKVHLSFDAFSSRKTLLSVQVELETEYKSAIMLKSLFGRIAVLQSEFLLERQSTRNRIFYWGTSPQGPLKDLFNLARNMNYILLQLDTT